MNEHNGWVSRDFWLEDWEERAIALVTSSIGKHFAVSEDQCLHCRAPRDLLAIGNCRSTWA